MIFFYKIGHINQYPENTEFIYSNLTPRYSRNKDVQYVVVFGLQYFIKEYLIERFEKEFFSKPLDVVLARYKRRMDNSLGKELAIIKGAYETLCDIFGYTVNAKNYKEMDTHIGLIYGDSITIGRQIEILERLKQKGISASNLVLGIGSFTYEYTTRDVHGFAMKATWGQIDETPVNIFKDPKTDSGVKKSAKGLLQVYEENGTLKLKQECTPEEEKQGLLQVIFERGILYKTSLSEIRDRLQNEMKKIK